MSRFFPELCSSYQDIKVKIDLSSYTTKSDGKNVTGVHTSSFPSKNDLASLKSDIDKLNVEKLKCFKFFGKFDVDNLNITELRTIPVNVKKLSNIVDNDVVKK